MAQLWPGKHQILLHYALLVVHQAKVLKCLMPDLAQHKKMSWFFAFLRLALLIFSMHHESPQYGHVAQLRPGKQTPFLFTLCILMVGIAHGIAASWSS